MRRAAWPLLCVLLIAASALLWLSGVAGHVVPERWMWQPDLWRQQPWTLWTAGLLHFLWPHLLGNALALWLAWPISTLALLMWPPIGGYYGLSGVVHAAAAIVALRAMAQPPLRWLGLLLGGGLITSTFLSLLVIPAVYTYVDDVAAWFGKLFHRQASAGKAPPAPGGAAATTDNIG